MSLAEIGHASLKRKRASFLFDAAWEDVCTIIMQEEQHMKFLSGRGKSFGKSHLLQYKQGLKRSIKTKGQKITWKVSRTMNLQ